MLPTGAKTPTTKTWTTPQGHIIGYEYRARWFQKKPFDLVLPYESRFGTYSQSRYTNYIGSSFEDASTLYRAKWNATYSTNADIKAYEKLKGAIHDTAALGVDFAEIRQTQHMAARAFGTIARVIHDVKHGNFTMASRRLGMYFVPPKTDVRKSWANNFLEYHFGWSPLLGDIHDAVKVLNNPVATFNLARGRGANYRQVVEKDESPSSSVWSYRWYDTYYYTQQGARVRAITNRNLHSLDQFGLLNPAVIAWELVPFSFVVDWFANVGNVLASFSDFAGMTLESTYTSRKYFVFCHGFNKYRPGYSPQTSNPIQWQGTGLQVTRSTSLTSPTFSVKTLRLPSSTRLVTAAALVTQLLGKR